jgi:imidazole glycerol-phosphate synthase subunit HisH
MITIIDYGVGNLGSVQNMLKKIGVENQITSDVRVISEAHKLILPGVGAFETAMACLKEKGFIELLTRKALIDNTLILGICLGMQLMTNSSEEGTGGEGLKWLDADTIKFQFKDKTFKVPHKGWNLVKATKKSFFDSDTREEIKFYFDHSYYVKLKNPQDELFSTNYGTEFTSGFQKENIFGVQFHPEKSHRYGMSLLSKFAAL